MTAAVDLVAQTFELFSAEEARRVRREVRAIATKVIANSDVLDDIESMLGEGLANALIHGSPEITVEVTADDFRLRVAIWDEGPARGNSPNGHAPIDQINHGRGLVIVGASAARWSLRTCLSFEVDLDKSPETVEAQASPRPALPLGGESRAGGRKFPAPPALGSTTE